MASQVRPLFILQQRIPSVILTRLTPRLKGRLSPGSQCGFRSKHKLVDKMFASKSFMHQQRKTGFNGVDDSLVVFIIHSFFLCFFSMFSHIDMYIQI